jgi:hypothetical protein
MWVPCHHSMARPRVADGAPASSCAGLLRISSRGQTISGGPLALVLGVGLTTLHRKKNEFVTKVNKEPLIWTDYLDKRPKLWNTDMRFGLWNVTSLYRAGFLMTVSRELSKYKLDLASL